MTCNMQVARSVLASLLHLEISILSQLETVLFVFFSMNTETLDCLENPFDVCGL